MTQEPDPNTTLSVPKATCIAVRKFLEQTQAKLPDEFESGRPIYKTLDNVLEYLGNAVSDGVDRTIEIKVKNAEDGEIRVCVTSVMHFPMSTVEKPDGAH